MFLWMFIEGLYLHNVVTVTVFQGRFPHVIYAAIGWGSPVVMTVRVFKTFKNITDIEIFRFKVIWAGFTANLKSNQKCWFGYNLTPYYWILEGPRLVVILVWKNDQISKVFNLTIFYFAAEFHFSSQHHQSPCRETSSKPHKRRWTSAESCPGGICIAATSRNNKFTEHDRSATRSFTFRICGVVLYHALSDLISRLFHCYDLLFPERWSKWKPVKKSLKKNNQMAEFLSPKNFLNFQFIEYNFQMSLCYFFSTFRSRCELWYWNL